MEEEEYRISGVDDRRAALRGAILLRQAKCPLDVRVVALITV